MCSTRLFSLSGALELIEHICALPNWSARIYKLPQPTRKRFFITYLLCLYHLNFLYLVYTVFCLALYIVFLFQTMNLRVLRSASADAPVPAIRLPSHRSWLWNSRWLSTRQLGSNKKIDLAIVCCGSTGEIWCCRKI